ncbi:hypothetical protein BJV82DRAFT_594355 [Fennellomyces sp. T-0311]|nr:hypothetical protein BJV82DRAFT_594355 [Fennellomyces sp. T-0311]
MPSIGDLPLEILDLVASLISLHDIITCLLVNHEWHTVFERVLYKSVDTRQRYMFLAFMQRLDGTAKSTLPLGQCVRELKICDGFMTCKRMNRLLELCPYVNSLTFRWQDSKAHEAHVTKTNHGASRRYFGTPARIMEMFPRITQLTLECEPKSRRNRTTLQHDDVSLYLNAAQNLRYLALHGVLRKLTYRQMDIIHEACPNLTHLKITITTSDYTSYVDILSTPTEATAESDERISDLDSPLWPAKAARMQRLEVCDESILLDFERWIRYAAAMYPRLRALYFSNWCWERSMNWSHDATPQEWRYDCDKPLLAQRCPQLRTVELADVSLPKEAMYQIFSGGELNQVMVKGECTDLVDAEGYKAMVDLVASKVSRLRLSLPSKFIGEPFTNATMCSRLVQLELVCSGLWTELVNVRVDCVLQCCPVLKDLTLVGVHGRANLATKNFTSTLKRLRLRCVDIQCGSLLRFVSKSCPQLSHLHMFRCTGPSLLPRFTLDFSSHHFESLCIYDHKSNKPPGARAKLFSLRTANDTTFRDVYLLPEISPPLMMNSRSLEFDETLVIDPNPAGKFIKLNTQQALNLLAHNEPAVLLGKRKHPDSLENDTLFERCKFEMEKGGCISLICASVAKVIVNGVYIVRNGACLH